MSFIKLDQVEIGQVVVLSPKSHRDSDNSYGWPVLATREEGNAIHSGGTHCESSVFTIRNPLSNGKSTTLEASDEEFFFFEIPNELIFN